MKGLLLTYFLTYGGALVALFNPFVGVCIYWLFDIVRPQYMFAWAGADGSYSEIVAIATMVGWAAKGFGSWSFGKAKGAVVLFFAFGFWVALSTLAAPNFDVSLPFFMEHAKRALMFVIAISLIDSLEKVKQLAWVITGAAGFLCLDFNLQYFGGVNQAALGYAGLDNNCLAIALVTCLAPAVFLGLSAKPAWQKAIAFGCAAVIGHAILLTFSRGGLLGLLVAGVFAVVVMPKRPRYFLAVGVAAIVALSIAGPELRDRFMSSFAEGTERDYSAQSRIDLWLDCLAIMRQNPLLGVGPDHFPLVAVDFGWNVGKEAHSLWLQLGAELGIPGVLLLLLFYITIFRRVWPLTKGTDNSDSAFWTRNAACIVVVSLAGFAFAAQFVSLEGLELPFYIAALGVGTLKCLTGKVEAKYAAQGVGPPAPDPRAAAGNGKLTSPRPVTRNHTAR